MHATVHAAVHSPKAKRSVAARHTLLDPYTRCRRTQSADSVHDHWVQLHSSAASDVRVFPLLGCVVKRFSTKSAQPCEIARMVAEGAVLERLHHRNIVEVWTWFERAGIYTLVTGRVRGQDLYDHITGLQAPPRWPAAGAILYQLADALAHCHALGVAHGDVKPENTMVGRDGVVTLIDFGLAVQCRQCGPGQPCRVATDFRRRVPVAPAGTVHYRAPEVAGAYYNPFAADVWALGQTAMVLLSCWDVQDAADAVAARAILPDDPPHVVAAVTALVEACTAVRPENRPTMFQVRRVLRGCLGPAIKCLDNNK